MVDLFLTARCWSSLLISDLTDVRSCSTKSGTRHVSVVLELLTSSGRRSPSPHRVSENPVCRPESGHKCNNFPGELLASIKSTALADPQGLGNFQPNPDRNFLSNHCCTARHLSNVRVPVDASTDWHLTRILPSAASSPCAKGPKYLYNRK